MFLDEERKDIEKREEDYQNELQGMGLLDTKSKTTGPENCKYPWELYQEAREAEGNELPSMVAKAKYKVLSLKERIPFRVKPGPIMLIKTTKKFNKNVHQSHCISVLSC